MIRELALKQVHSPLQLIHAPRFQSRGIQLYLKRDDLIHPHVSGNKWRKLKYNLLTAQQEKHEALLTFGGAYSNHILATAHAGRLWGFRTIGIIRGEAYEPLNPVLAEAQDAGMTLAYMPRWQYRQKEDVAILAELNRQWGRFYLLPEGGTNPLAVQGCREVIDEIEVSFDIICVPCGTGGTLAGLIKGLQPNQQAIGFGVLKGETFLADQVQALLGSPQSPTPSWSINFDYHFGGYAKQPPALLDFIHTFQQDHQITLEPVYTGKMLFGLYDLIERGYFAPNQTIVAVHTGNSGG